jgi:hypothetical protein
MQVDRCVLCVDTTDMYLKIQNLLVSPPGCPQWAVARDTAAKSSASLGEQ